jgi:heat shock protein HslJ
MLIPLRRLLVLSVFALGACAERATTGPDSWRPSDLVLGVGASATPLVGTRWQLVRLESEAVSAPFDGWLRVTPLAGALDVQLSVGCNRIHGAVDTVGTRLRAASLVSTRMSCGEVLDTQERRATAALSATGYFGVRGDTLWLYDAVFRERMRLHAAPEG